MKAHIGVEAVSALVHSVVGTAANVNDVTQAGAAWARATLNKYPKSGRRIRKSLI